MERRAAFVLLGMLYLAGTLESVQAVIYSGPTIVHKGQPWSIECSGLQPDDNIRWTRNGQTLEPELASGQLIVRPKAKTGGSELAAIQATEFHEGDYKCTPDSSDAFHLSLYFDVKIRVLTQKETPLSLECGNRSTGDKAIWYKEKMPILTTMVGKEDLIKIDNETGTLDVLKIDDIIVYGNYSCKVGNTSTDYRIVPKPTVVLPESTSVVEGEKLLLVCNGKHSPGVKIIWTFGNQNYTASKGRVKISQDQERGIYGAVLTVENIEMNDRGIIHCRVSYNWSDPVEGHSAQAVTLLRVKDKLAALWPFLGICGEVVVLCAIILVYEKKRNKAELDESDTEQSPDTKPTPNKDSDVRQRK
ncbi:basigin [Vespa velutina]|uniref:basigin n=1 Tax=Vespa crabro TaxID=7445 RepID=UPI001F0170AA|nr:basigin [Vespa crabro]XP_047349776.1 basigin [Vespa velutina]